MVTVLTEKKNRNDLGDYDFKEGIDEDLRDGKGSSGGGIRGHIFVDEVPYNI